MTCYLRNGRKKQRNNLIELPDTLHRECKTFLHLWQGNDVHGHILITSSNPRARQDLSTFVIFA